MASSAEIWLLNKISDLTVRCGVSPIVAEIYLEFVMPKDSKDNNSKCYYTLRGMDGAASTPEEEQKVQKVWSLLGMDGGGYRRVDTLDEVAEIVDRALSLAPRARVR